MKQSPRFMSRYILKYYSDTLNSTRLFSALPALVLFSAAGIDSPWPTVLKRSASIPAATKWAFTAAARRSESGLL